MFKRIILLLIVLSFISCSDSKKNKKILSESTGRLTHLLVVCDQQNWDGIIGKSIRSVFSSSLGGLPNPEPIFTVSHLPNSVFSGFTKKNRLVLKAKCFCKASSFSRIKRVFKSRDFGASKIVKRRDN